MYKTSPLREPHISLPQSLPGRRWQSWVSEQRKPLHNTAHAKVRPISREKSAPMCGDVPTQMSTMHNPAQAPKGPEQNRTKSRFKLPTAQHM